MDAMMQIGLWVLAGLVLMALLSRRRKRRAMR
jgi:hypothetical protein